MGIYGIDFSISGLEFLGHGSVTLFILDDDYGIVAIAPQDSLQPSWWDDYPFYLFGEDYNHS